MRAIIAFVLTAVVAQAQQYIISTVAGGAPIPTPIAATSASIGGPFALAVAPAGDVYFTGYGSTVYKVDVRGILTRVAGNGRIGFSSDDIPAASAQLFFPGSLAVDAASNLYLTDSYRIRKVTTDGMLLTVAGTGFPGSSGDGGPATRAQINPSAFAIDVTGNLFIADSFRIRKVAINGVISTIAGSGISGYSGDGGLAANAQIGDVTGLVLDTAGSLYIAEPYNFRVRKIQVNGIISTVAGNGFCCSSGDGGPATSAQLAYPRGGLAVDPSGNLYIVDTDNNRIRKVSPSGIITNFAGSDYVTGFTGDGSPAASAKLASPCRIGLDASGNMYISDTGNLRIRKITQNGIITTIAGNGSLGYSGDGSPATSAQLSDPQAAAVDAAGTLYIADSGNNRLRRVGTNNIITNLAGTDSYGSFYDDGPATRAPLAFPFGVTVDTAGNLYIAEGSRIRKISTNGIIITTVAGVNVAGYSGDGGPATNAQLSWSRGIAVDASGNVYFSDTNNHRIRKVSTNGIITTFAGNGSAGYSGDGGLATSAQIDYPTAVALDGLGNLYLADTANHRIRKIARNGTITTVAGDGFQGYFGDGGPAASARLDLPLGLAVDTMGNLYIADANNRVIRKISVNGIITTIAGIGRFYGYSGDGGPAASAQLSDPAGLAVDAIGNVYIADDSNNAIRMLKPIPSQVAAIATVNSASNLSGPIAPGQIVVLYGTGIGPAQLVQARQDSQGRYSTILAGTRVLFNGIPSSMLYTSATQVSAIVPYAITGNIVGIQIEYQGVKSDPMAVSLAQSAPGIFTADSTGKGQAAAVNEDGSLNSTSKPAKAGIIVSVYATGEGQTSPAGVDGQPAKTPLPKPLLPVQVFIDGKSAEVTYAGGAPGLVAGLMQVNVRIPSNARAGNVAIFMVVGSASSQLEATVAVSNN